MWDKVSAFAAVGSLVISVVALMVARSGNENSSKISSEALKTARQANEIALGLISEPPVVEIYSKQEEPMLFAGADALKEHLKFKISLRNSGKVAVDAIAMELIGIMPLTYPVGEEDNSVRPLPSVKAALTLDTMILPNGLMHIDMRVPVLMYLEHLVKALPDTSKYYTTAINIVLSPRAKGDDAPSGVPSGKTTKDRALLIVKFDPEIMQTEQVAKLLQSREIAHRIYSP